MRAPQLSRRKVKDAAYAKREVSVAQHIPYLHHWDHETILTKNKELLQVIRVDGFAFETADDEDVDIKKMVRNSLFKSLATGTIALWFHTVRTKQNTYPKGNFAPGFSRYINEQWQKRHKTHETFTNELYITVIRKADTAGAAKFEHMAKSLLEAGNQESREASMKESFKELKEVTFRIIASLKDYGARVLTVRETPQGAFSEPLEFLGKLVNAGASQPMLVPTMDISHYLPNRRLYFGDRAIEVRSATGRYYAAMTSVKEYSASTSAGMMDAFLQLPFEFIISQSFVYINRQTNIDRMQLQQRRMMQAEDVAVSQVAEISEALDMTMSGHVAFGSHHMTVMSMAPDIKTLERNVSYVNAELVNLNINPVRENMIMEQCYWAQLPGNFDYIGRKADINSLNISGLASLHNYPVGNIKGNHWGNAVTVLDTASGTPYFFNFHSRDVGHTTIIGPTGAGKTVLMNFLAAQAMKFNCRMFFFDKDRGAEIFLRAIRGKYTVIEPGQQCNFNPLQLPDTPENRSFLAEWLTALVTVHDEPFSADDMQTINQAVAGNYKLAPQDRTLSNISPFLGLEGPGTLASRMKMWHGSGQYAGVFDNPEDTLNFNTHNVFGFEMNEVLSDRVTLAPVLMYLFQRINHSLDGTPTIIVLDEAWALIDNKIFSAKIKDWLKTLRKLNAMVVFATQSVEDATSSTISDTLIQQTATQIFLPNPKATEQYRQAFMLSEREYNLLKTTDPGSRFFLLKQGKDVVVARIDLRGMDDIVNVLSGRAETVRILRKIREEVGEDPDIWLPLFQQRVREHNESYKDPTEEEDEEDF